MGEGSYLAAQAFAAAAGDEFAHEQQLKIVDHFDAREREEQMLVAALDLQGHLEAALNAGQRADAFRLLAVNAMKDL
jgi:hypothetical protein